MTTKAEDARTCPERGTGSGPFQPTLAHNDNDSKNEVRAWAPPYALNCYSLGTPHDNDRHTDAHMLHAGGMRLGCSVEASRSQNQVPR
jgi:hypothetical protein